MTYRVQTCTAGVWRDVREPYHSAWAALARFDREVEAKDYGVRVVTDEGRQVAAFWPARTA